MKRIIYQKNEIINGICVIDDLGTNYISNNGIIISHCVLFQCPFCENTFKAHVGSVKRKLTTSCGCVVSKIVSERNYRHGYRFTSIYKVWQAMKTRCDKSNNCSADNYINRGIKYCKEWSTFIPFMEWALSNGYSIGLTLDRINNDGNYEPTNCRWVTRIVNNNNKRLLPKNNLTGYCGVSFFKNKYVVHIGYNNINHYLGSFDNIIDAVSARNIFIIDNDIPKKLNPIPTS